jgi:hypothetical protein
MDAPGRSLAPLLLLSLLSKPIQRQQSRKERKPKGGSLMGSGLLLILLIVLLLAVLPAWPYSRGWGYYPSGGLGAVLVVLLVLVFMGVV